MEKNQKEIEKNQKEREDRPEAAVGAIIEQTPAGRLGEVGDMADAVVFLCSDAARFITGAGLPVDGGMGM